MKAQRSKTEDDDWACEARRYYFNIVGKYGAPVQTLLKKASSLEIATICPLHGPILKENLGYYLDIYNTWSSYAPEDKGILVAYASIHGNTGEAANRLADILREKGAEKVVVSDLAREDMAEVIEDAFRYSGKWLLGAYSRKGYEGSFGVIEKCGNRRAGCDYPFYLKRQRYPSAGTACGSDAVR